MFECSKHRASRGTRRMVSAGLRVEQSGGGGGDWRLCAAMSSKSIRGAGHRSLQSVPSGRRSEQCIRRRNARCHSSPPSCPPAAQARRRRVGTEGDARSVYCMYRNGEPRTTSVRSQSDTLHTDGHKHSPLPITWLFSQFDCTTSIVLDTRVRSMQMRARRTSSVRTLERLPVSCSRRRKWAAARASASQVQCNALESDRRDLFRYG